MSGSVLDEAPNLGNKLLDSSKAARENFGALASGLPSIRRRHRRVVAFQAFMDESGSGSKQGPIFMLSGYVSPHYWWEDFSDLWQALLDGPPKLAYFKMKEAASLSGEFANMKILERNERVAKAIDLIKLVVHASLSSAVPFGLYSRIVKGKVPQDFDSPAFLAMFDVMTKAVENQLSIKANKPAEPVEPVDFIFDDHVKWQPIVPATYLFWKHVSPPDHQALMGSPPIFRDDKKFLPLQAADLQSWYFRRLFAEKLRGERFPKGLPKEFFHILDTIPTLMSMWDAPRLQSLADGVVTRRPRPINGYEDGWPRRLASIHELLEKIDVEESA